MSKKYVTLDNYSQNTLSKEDNQDWSMSKCAGGLCKVGGGQQLHKEDFKVSSEEQYGSFSLRAAVRPPYNQSWGTEDGVYPKKIYPAVS